MPLSSQKQREMSDEKNRKYDYREEAGDDGQGDGN
jgi:hypothetical protein